MKKKQISPKTKEKRIILATSIITLVSFLYKIGIGIMTMSIVLLIASIPTLMIFCAKLLFVNNVTKTRDKKKKAYFFIMLSTLIYSLIFIAFVVLKVNGIDISNNNTYDGYKSFIILFLIITFALSIKNLKTALEKTDIMVIGLKEITFVSCLSDLVIIEEFVSRIILHYYNITLLYIINSYFTLVIGSIMFIISFIMLIRWIRYKVEI